MYKRILYNYTLAFFFFEIFVLGSFGCAGAPGRRGAGAPGRRGAGAPGRRGAGSRYQPFKKLSKNPLNKPVREYESHRVGLYVKEAMALLQYL